MFFFLLLNFWNGIVSIFSFTIIARESYGEDIADTETERSTGHSDEDKYEGSFIDDSDPKLFPPSPLSDDKGMLSITSTSLSIFIDS